MFSRIEPASSQGLCPTNEMRGLSSAAVPSMPLSSTLPCTSLASPRRPYSKVDFPAPTSPWSTVKLPEGSSST
eukprot:scaffold26203_cov65-Phaeocystis_antarctica.AAC.3